MEDESRSGDEGTRPVEIAGVPVELVGPVRSDRNADETVGTLRTVQGRGASAEQQRHDAGVAVHDPDFARRLPALSTTLNRTTFVVGK